MAVFHDPLALSRPDEGHAANEERWVTPGQSQEGQLTLIVHTYRNRRGSRGDPDHLGAPADQARNQAIPRRDLLMKDEYDFSAAARGKFYRPDAQLIPPVHLDPDVLASLADRANGVSLSGLVNDLLKKDIALIEAAK
jgi:hypothetical protein